MKVKAWVKTTAIAAAGGALTALVTGLTERERLGIYFGSGRLAAMVATGAVTAVIPWLLRRPTIRRCDDAAPADDVGQARDFRPPSGPDSS